MHGPAEPRRSDPPPSGGHASVGRGTLTRESALSFLSLGIMAVGKALFIVLTANFYGAEGQGIVTLGIAVTVSVALFVCLGTDRANTLLAGRRGVALETLHGNSVGLALGALLVSVPLVELLFRAFSDSIFDGFPGDARLLLVVLIPLQVYHRQVEGLLLGRRLFGLLAQGIALQFGIVLVGLVALWQLGRPVVYVLALWALGLLGKGVYTATRLLWSASPASRLSLGILRDQVREGLKMLAGDAANLLNLRLDAYFIAYFTSIESLGLYAVATMIAEAVLYIPKALGRVLFSRVAEAGESSLDGRLTARIFVAAWTCTLVAILIIQALYSPLVRIVFGQDFDPSVAPGRILLVATLVYGLGLLAMNLLFGLGHAARNARVGFVALIVNAAANVVAIPVLGIVGAAWASLASYSTYFVLNMASVRRVLPSGMRVRDLFMPRIADLRRLGADLVAMGVEGARRRSDRS